MFNLELNMMLIVLMEFAYIRHSRTLLKIRWISVYEGDKFLTSLHGSRNGWNKVKQTLNRVGYLETPLLALEHDLWYLLVYLPQEIQDLSYNFSTGINSMINSMY